jgi:hypothetical protein
MYVQARVAHELLYSFSSEPSIAIRFTGLRSQRVLVLRTLRFCVDDSRCWALTIRASMPNGLTSKQMISTLKHYSCARNMLQPKAGIPQLIVLVCRLKGFIIQGIGIILGSAMIHHQQYIGPHERYPTERIQPIVTQAAACATTSTPLSKLNASPSPCTTVFWRRYAVPQEHLCHLLHANAAAALAK